MNNQLTSVNRFPFIIQITDHRKFSFRIVLKLIKMFRVKTSGFIQSIVKLASCYTGIAGYIQVNYKFINQIKKRSFINISMRPVKPVNRITSHRFIKS